MELTSDNLGGRVAGMWDSVGELISKSCCYFSVVVERFGGNGKELIRMGFGTFFRLRDLIMPHKREGLHLF